MKKLLPWFGVLAVLVVVFGTVNTVVQQAQRRDANYPQIQLAEDTAAALDHGGKPLSLVHGNVDLAASLAPFTVIYDKSGNVIAGSGYLNGHVPRAPLGVLTASRSDTYNAVTWQPQAGVRIASVSVAANNYYVLSGRSLTEVEKNENVTFQYSLFGGLVSMVLFGLVLYTSSVKH
jgi:hypothetical protein